MYDGFDTLQSCFPCMYDGFDTLQSCHAFSKECKDPKDAAFPCVDDSSQLQVEYPKFVLSCGDLHALVDTQDTPVVIYANAITEGLFSLLMYDTPNSFLHFGAVNIPAADLMEGYDLMSGDVFQEYTGPAPSAFLKFFIGRNPNNYEWMLKEQEGEVEVPKAKLFGFKYESVVGDMPTATTHFASNFCVSSL